MSKRGQRRRSNRPRKRSKPKEPVEETQPKDKKPTKQ